MEKIFALYTVDIMQFKLIRENFSSKCDIFPVPDVGSLDNFCRKFEPDGIFVFRNDLCQKLEEFSLYSGIPLHILDDIQEIDLFVDEIPDDAIDLNDYKCEAFSKMAGSSQTMQSLKKEIVRIARRNANVLIIGETGTGKELVANAIHELSEHSDKKIVTVNISELAPSLVEAALFGNVKGAFTGADCDTEGFFSKADGTTIFLDEIGELSMEIQAKLLRVLQFHEFQKVGSNEVLHSNFRLICATNANLVQKVHDEKFRNDLLQRIDVLRINTPPLRKHLLDVMEIVHSYLKAKNEKRTFTPSAVMYLQSLRWDRGNVRQLETCLERTLARCDSEEIDGSDLRF